jgi:hypothetical protein
MQLEVYSEVLQRRHTRAGDTRPVTWEPAETIALLGQLDDVVRQARAVPLTDQARLDLRTVEPLLGRLRMAGRDGPPGLAGALDELETLVRGAKAIPLTDEIRVERREIYDRLDRLRACCAAPSREHLRPEVARVLDELDAFLGGAKTVPLTAQVRLDREQAESLAGRLRTALRDPSPQAAAALDELDALLHGAKSIPFTHDIRVGIVELYETLDRISAA